MRIHLGLFQQVLRKSKSHKLDAFNKMCVQISINLDINYDPCQDIDLRRTLTKIILLLETSRLSIIFARIEST